MPNATLVLVIVVATAAAAVIVARTRLSADYGFDFKNLSRKPTELHHKHNINVI